MLIENKTKFSDRKILGKTVFEHLTIKLYEHFDKFRTAEEKLEFERNKNEEAGTLIIPADKPIDSDILNLLIDFHMGKDSISNFHKISEMLKIEINFKHEEQGVRILDVNRCLIDFDVKIGKGTVIYPDVIIEGETVIGEGCLIGAGCFLKNMKIGNGTKMMNTVAYDSEVGDKTETGPFAYIRPGSKIGSGCKVGDFVEVKNSTLGDGAKASHLAYIGDSDIGNGVNIGCGVVTVNYDGRNKFRTVVEDDCFIGCNSNLVAPVNVKKGAFIAAGSTITDDVPEETLAIARARQVNKDGWKRP
jgi:bifunctional UDP-N-acetylglucosamine pyrophosphorylase/glucosamine-1-phosphate N-acetyltransferase